MNQRKPRSIPRPSPVLATVAALATLAAAPAAAQLKLKPDDTWQQALTAGLTWTSGNSDSLATHLNAEAGIENAERRWLLYGRAVYGRNDGETATQNAGLGALSNRELGNQWFLHNGIDLFRDKLANLSVRTTVNLGPGYHLIKNEQDYWDVFAGAGYIHERYREATEVGGRIRSSYGRMEALLGTESQTHLSPTTTWKQRFVIYPSLDKSGEYRATFDTSLSVAMTSRLSLTASLGARHNSDPGSGIDKNDYLFVTGITFASR